MQWNSFELPDFSSELLELTTKIKKQKKHQNKRNKQERFCSSMIKIQVKFNSKVILWYCCKPRDKNTKFEWESEREQERAREKEKDEKARVKNRE